LINVNPPPETPPQTAPQGEPPQPVATPPQQTVPRGEPARFHCEPNSKTPAQIKWGEERIFWVELSESEFGMSKYLVNSFGSNSIKMAINLGRRYSFKNSNCPLKWLF
jgi:hypothetical protein